MGSSVNLPYDSRGFDHIHVARCIALVRLQWQVFLESTLSFDAFVALVQHEDCVLDGVLEDHFATFKLDDFLDYQRTLSERVSQAAKPRPNNVVVLSDDPAVVAGLGGPDGLLRAIVGTKMLVDLESLRDDLHIGNKNTRRMFGVMRRDAEQYTSSEALLEYTVANLFDTKSGRHDPEWVFRIVKDMREKWSRRVAFAVPHFDGVVKELTHEFIAWLRRHPKAIHSVTWDAFERLVAEIFVSFGFEVELTARTKNRSADLIAVKHIAPGVETRFLVECKHLRRSKVGLDVVNAVLGAKAREGADHAILVTTSSFTSEVLAQEPRLRDLRLHLRDGAAVQEWVKTLDPRTHAGTHVDRGAGIHSVMI